MAIIGFEQVLMQELHRLFSVGSLVVFCIRERICGYHQSGCVDLMEIPQLYHVLDMDRNFFSSFNNKKTFKVLIKIFDALINL